MKVRAVILAGGEGTRLSVLTAKRAKPAVPFAGKYRIIDFTLSNCVNSNIFDVIILTQYRPHSLNRSYWARPALGSRSEFHRRRPDVAALQGAQGHGLVQRHGGCGLAKSELRGRGQPDYILILSGDHIYEMDYDMLIDFQLHAVPMRRSARSECQWMRPAATESWM